MNTVTYVTDGERHLVCRPYSVENLHEMAKELGINRCWFHSPDHYDIPKLRKVEIEAKCEMVSSREILKIIGRIPTELVPCIYTGEDDQS